MDELNESTFSGTLGKTPTENAAFPVGNDEGPKGFPVREEPKAFVRGDVVRLKSGGPPMTVRGVHDDSPSEGTHCCGDLDCIWCCENVLHGGSFHPDLLVACEASKVP